MDEGLTKAFTPFSSQRPTVPISLPLLAPHHPKPTMFRATFRRLASHTKCPVHTDCRPNLHNVAPPIPYLDTEPSLPTTKVNFKGHPLPPPRTSISYALARGDEDVFVRYLRNGNWPHKPNFGALHLKFPRVRSLVTRVVEYNQFDVVKEKVDEETGETIKFTWPAGTLETIYESFVVDQNTYDRESRIALQNHQVLDPRTQILENLVNVNYTYLSTNEKDGFPEIGEGFKGRVGTYWDHCESFLKTERAFGEELEERRRYMERKRVAREADDAREAKEAEENDEDDEEDEDEEGEEDEEDAEGEESDEEEVESEEDKVREEIMEKVIKEVLDNVARQTQGRRGGSWKN
ncbi:BQ5605_C005g03317 [Microbotryum silenes-dioicae]|uniref:BQ5605_C005g03317 protein n=1 Tax=Microbotryum silenes-dioicae TaxID=796604 RepID=A0A2X0PCI6_9BASI|nr:BQ5605_C005g03317 [Microbotryum silenes-dioicae]